jgi:hypothetical protein
VGDGTAASGDETASVMEGPWHVVPLIDVTQLTNGLWIKFLLSVKLPFPAQPFGLRTWPASGARQMGGCEA